MKGVHKVFEWILQNRKKEFLICDRKLLRMEEQTFLNWVAQKYSINLKTRKNKWSSKYPFFFILVGTEFIFILQE